MTHRADQIIEAVAAALAASTTLGIPSANIFQHRTLSLADDQGELPAATVNFGDDDPVSDTGTDNFAFIDSLLDITVTLYVAGDNEAAVKRDLLDKRRRVHTALMTDDTLGLSFCLGVRYGGATKPDLDATVERLVGAYETRWRVLYRQNITDPGD